MMNLILTIDDVFKVSFWISTNLELIEMNFGQF